MISYREFEMVSVSSVGLNDMYIYDIILYRPWNHSKDTPSKFSYVH